MNRLKVVQMGTTVQGVVLRGDRNNPEPESFRVRLPFGEVDIVRTTTDGYWVHVIANGPESRLLEQPARPGVVADARIDLHGECASETVELASQVSDPRTYHVAVRIEAARSAEEPAEAGGKE